MASWSSPEEEGQGEGAGAEGEVVAAGSAASCGALRAAASPLSPPPKRACPPPHSQSTRSNRPSAITTPGARATPPPRGRGLGGRAPGTAGSSGRAQLMEDASLRVSGGAAEVAAPSGGGRPPRRGRWLAGEAIAAGWKGGGAAGSAGRRARERCKPRPSEAVEEDDASPVLSAAQTVRRATRRVSACRTDARIGSGDRVVGAEPVAPPGVGRGRMKKRVRDGRRARAPASRISKNARGGHVHARSP